MKTVANHIRVLLIIMAAAWAAFSCSRIERSEYIAEGISRLLAAYRYETIHDVRYNLSFAIDTGRSSPIAGSAVIEFGLGAGREPVVIDFRMPNDHLKSVVVNGREMETGLTNGHILIDRDLLTRRYNRVEIGFRAGDLSLNRNDEYLYTLLVPDRASTLFPCFDQPDLKGRFTLTLDIPGGYRAMSNNPLVSADSAGGRVTLHFSETPPISTYLFAFAAGRFELVEKEIGGRRMEMLHRETRPGYIDNNAGEIFRLHHDALEWMEEYTGIPYPFEKFGFVLLPPFQYSGMEHPGSIFYRASSLLLEPSPTLNELLSRATLIAHETSHIWFGDLVTMKWFDDVWLKEVFAGYMSDKIAGPAFPGINHDLRFLLSRYPAAYEVDRTAGTNPVLQQLDNLKDAGSLYGAIIYNKAPIVMRQLEQMIGEETLQRGLQIYLEKYAWDNARWDDLIAILEETSRKPLAEWSRMWIREAGMPVITPVVSEADEWQISFLENDPAGMLRHWPQTLETMVITATDTVTAVMTPDRTGPHITTAEPPLCIIPDISGRAYGTFLADSATIGYLLEHLPDVQDPLLKGILWINLYENLVNGTVSPEGFWRTAFRDLLKITDPQLRSYVIGRLTSAWWRFLSPGERTEFISLTEALFRSKLSAAESASDRRTWFGALRNVTGTHQGLLYLRSVWSSGKLPGGVPLSEDELCTLALTLALRGVSDADRIIAAQRGRITSRERLERFDFVTPAVSPDQEVRDALFERLRDPANRTREPWVLEALGYLHHPLVAERAEHYILPSLEMLEEVKMTGDIFFPGGWIGTTLAGHRSENAREIVSGFLENHPDYPADLRLKILQAADHLLRENRQTGNS